MLKNLMNFVVVDLSGHAFAGSIRDKDRCHAANSAAGARITGVTETFRWTPETSEGAPIVEVAGQIFTGASYERRMGRAQTSQGNIDPYFVSLLDMTTGEIRTETVMRHEITATNGYWDLNEYGILLGIPKSDPLAFVNLVFDQPSSWVRDPYSYSARLDNMNGFVATGALSSGWELTEYTDKIEAFYAFGPEGMPFDFAQVSAPLDLFTVGHDYTYDLGAGDGVYERIVVPEPGPLPLLAAALLLWVRAPWQSRARTDGA
jgi:hypothetical protein